MKASLPSCSPWPPSWPLAAVTTTTAARAAPAGAGTAAAHRLGRRVDDRGARGVRARIRRGGGDQCGSASPAPTSWRPRSARVSSRTSSRPPTQAARRALRRGPRPSRWSSPPTSSSWRSRRLRHQVGRRPHQPGTKIAIGSESVPIGSYTREALAKLPARPGEGDPRQRPLERARRQGDRRQGHAGRG